MRKINLEQIQKNTKEIHEISSQISLLQEELEDSLTAIDRNSLDYQKGKISKEVFESNEKKIKIESAKKIKRIGELITNGLKLLEKIKKEIQAQKLKKR
jgi:Na+/phosphate symporter